MKKLLLILTLVSFAGATNWFKSAYKPGTGYSPNWYGELNWAPPATVIYYNDKKGICVGHMESELPPGVTDLTSDEVEKITADTSGAWYGFKLLHRWDEPVRDTVSE